MKKKPNKLTPKAAVAWSAMFGKNDPRLKFLRSGPTEKLTSLLEGVFNQGPEISPMYFLIGMDPRFRDTTPNELFEMLVSVLRTRVPNAQRSQTGPLASDCKPGVLPVLAAAVGWPFSSVLFAYVTELVQCEHCLWTAARTSLKTAGLKFHEKLASLVLLQRCFLRCPKHA